MKLQVRYYGDPILRKKCKLVNNISDEIRTLVADMIETMDLMNGLGLSANQVGFLYNLFIIRPEIKDDKGDFILGPVEVYINSVLSNPSKELETMSEGCLSIPGIYADVERPYSIHIESMDLNGNKISADVTGFKARELMHENDHLNGTFFVDRISEYSRQSLKKDLLKMKEKYKKI